MAKASLKVSKATLDISKVLVVDELLTSRVGGQKNIVKVPVSLFRNNKFIATRGPDKGKRIGQSYADTAVAAIRKLYAISLYGVAESYETGNLPKADMSWPGGVGQQGLGKGGKRGVAENVRMRTGGGKARSWSDDTPATFNKYTSATLARYRNFYGFSVPGYPARKNKGAQHYDRLRKSHNISSKLVGARGQHKKYLSLTGRTAKDIQGLLKSPAQTLSNSGKQSANALGIHAEFKYRPLKNKIPRIRHRGGAPVHVITGRITGFEKPVKRFPFAARIFATPFAEGINTEGTKLSVPDIGNLSKALSVTRATALLSHNEGRRPFIRRYMRNQHRYIKQYVQNQLGLLK